MAGFCAKAKSRCLRAGILGKIARDRSNELFPKGTFPGNEGDVFRDVFWHALMIIDGLPDRWVEEFGEQYEIWPGNPGKAKLADIENNDFGRRVGKGLAGSGLSRDIATQKADVLIGNMVQNHGTGLNFDF